MAARHGLIELLSVALQSIERHYLSDTGIEMPVGVDPPKMSEILHITFRLLRFSLGLPVIASVTPVGPRPDFGRLAAAFARVILVSKASNLLGTHAHGHSSVCQSLSVKGLVQG